MAISELRLEDREVAEIMLMVREVTTGVVVSLVTLALPIEPVELGSTVMKEVL